MNGPEYPDTLTINVQEDIDDRAAQVLKALNDINLLPEFMHHIVSFSPSWMVLCALEADLLAFHGRNRWCGSLDGWELVVGTSPFILEDVPEYTGYGQVQAWLVYEGEWVLTINPSFIRQQKNTDDVLVWDAACFYEQSISLARVHLADDSAIHLNRAMHQTMREIDELEAAFGAEEK
jgi:hypothetical protein